MNSRPLTVAGWRTLLGAHGFDIEQVHTAEMALLDVRRVLADEGLWRALQIGRRLLFDAEVRGRVTRMRRTFHTHRQSIVAVSIVTRKPDAADEAE